MTVAAEGSFSWAAGQHVALRAHGTDVDPSYYSIASADIRHHETPTEAESVLFELAVNAAAAKLGKPLEQGLLLEISQPGGGPDLDRLRQAKDVSLVGIGTGVAPLRAIAQSLLPEGLDQGEAASPRVTLLQGARKVEDCLFMDELSRKSGLRYHPILSRTVEGEWSGRTGRVQAHVQDLCSTEGEFCVCGSKAMVAEISAQLANMGVSAERVFAEGY